MKNFKKIFTTSAYLNYPIIGHNFVKFLNVDFWEPLQKLLGPIQDKNVSFGDQRGFFQNIDHCHLPIIIVPYHCAEIQKYSLHLFQEQGVRGFGPNFP